MKGEIRFSFISAAIFTGLLCLAGPVRGADDANSAELAGVFGHSLHGEAFDEGPRQGAYLMQGMPDVDFAVNTRSPDAQKFFNQGVGQLHGFWYYEAERSFRQVLKLDTNCVMAYWGLAMANVNNEERAKEFIAKGVKFTNGIPRRELLYIDSLAKFYLDPPKNATERHRRYVKALEQIVEEFPEDIEAKALLVFKIWENNGRQRISSHTATDALALDVLERAPMHPVHHARIHLWNNEADRRALDSAARCGQGSPGIAHMWHMPGHTYSALHRYADAAWQQEASARVDHAYMMQNRVLPDQIHNYAHNNDWLVKNFGYLGRVQDALDLAKNLVELPRHPEFNNFDAPARRAEDSEDDEASDANNYRNANRNSSASYGRNRLLELLVQWELWEELIALSSTMYLEPTEMPVEQAKRARALGLAYFATDDLRRAKTQIAEITKALRLQKELRHDDAENAEDKAKEDKKNDTDVTKAMTDAIRSHASKIKAIENALAELRLQNSIAAGEMESANKQMEDLKDVPKERLARLWLKLGDEEKALKLAREAAERATNQVYALANYADLLAQCGKENETETTFAALRRVAAHSDLDLPVLERLKPVAQQLGLPEDWRETIQPATDVGKRPPLETLGPFRWQPWPAIDWALKKSDGRELGLKSYEGRPVILIFYLGHGCLQCMEQLNAFAPKAREFDRAGISLVAISTDSVEGLRKTLAQSSSGNGFPFPVVSDEPLATFKAYRAYDDFEEMALHGTFLIDGNGFVRWQDISFAPFKDTEFLLKESQRLLNLPASPEFAVKSPRSIFKRLLSPRAKALSQ